MKKIAQIKKEIPTQNQLSNNTDKVKGGTCSCDEKRKSNNYSGGWSSWSGWSGGW